MVSHSCLGVLSPRKTSVIMLNVKADVEAASLRHLKPPLHFDDRLRKTFSQHGNEIKVYIST